MILIPIRIVRLSCLAICIVSFSLAVYAQSSDLTLPSAVTTNEINGTIKARDIGDSRLTSYFYTFDGGQGDVFINAVTKNFNGDIDVFAAEGLRPLTKMVIYSDGGENETGRLVYLRKPEQLILRVEGRSPNDDPATFRIKFAGSFIAANEQKRLQDPTVAKQETDPGSGVRVNSVGTIIAVVPKPQPTPKAKTETPEPVASATDNVTKSTPSKSEAEKSRSPAIPGIAKSPIAKRPKNPISTSKPKANASDAKTATEKPPTKSREVAKDEPAPPAKPAAKDAPDVKTVFKSSSKAKKETARPKASSALEKPLPPPAAKPPDPMASIRLIVQLKDGDMIERPMSEIKKFSWDKGVLTVIASDGSIKKYSIFDVAKVTIE